MLLATDANGHPIQAFPLYYGKVNLQAAAGVVGVCRLVRCVVAGNIIVTFPCAPADPKTIAMTAGQDLSIPGGGSVNLTGSAGTFHVA
jgi:hypothetical protein